MPLTKIELNNVTVFHELAVEFDPGVNILLGENGVGKTHIMKLLYAACQAKKSEVTFPYKTVMVFRPDDSNLGRLVNRNADSTNGASVRVSSDDASMAMKFSQKTTKYDADVTGKASWEKQLSDLSSVFIPAKEILSNAWNLSNAVRQGNIIFDDTFSRQETFVLNTKLKSHKCSINRCRYLRCAGRFRSIANDSSDISKCIDDCQGNLLIGSTIHIGNTCTGATGSTDCTTVRRKTSNIIFLMDRNQIADNKRTAKLLMRYFPFICKHNNRKRHRHALITTS